MPKNLLIALGCLGMLVLMLQDAPAKSSVAPKASVDFGDDPKPPGPAIGSPPPGAPLGAVKDAEFSAPVITDTQDLKKAAGASAFSDVLPADVAPPKPVGSAPPITPTGPVASTAPVATDWLNNVFPAAAYGGKRFCAVAVTPTTLLSASHAAPYANASVGVEGQWISASVTHPPAAGAGQRDAAILTVPNGNFPSMPVRAPRYYEPVTIYGLVSKKPQRGFMSHAWGVSLTPGSPGITAGDSGGAVVADDGSLVGIISGFENGNLTGTSHNPLVVYITRADVFLPYIPKSAPRGAGYGTAKPSAFDLPPDTSAVFQYNTTPNTGQGNCQNGQCTVPIRRGRWR